MHSESLKVHLECDLNLPKVHRHIGKVYRQRVSKVGPQYRMENCLILCECSIYAILSSPTGGSNVIGNKLFLNLYIHRPICNLFIQAKDNILRFLNYDRERTLRGILKMVRTTRFCKVVSPVKRD